MHTFTIKARNWIYHHPIYSTILNCLPTVDISFPAWGVSVTLPSCKLTVIFLFSLLYCFQDSDTSLWRWTSCFTLLGVLSLTGYVRAQITLKDAKQAILVAWNFYQEANPSDPKFYDQRITLEDGKRVNAGCWFGGNFGTRSTFR